MAGESFRNVSERFGTSATALFRHRQEHISKALVKAKEARDVARADTLLEDVRRGEGRAERLYSAAEEILNRELKSKDHRTALSAIKAAVSVMGEARAYMELRGELNGELGRNASPPPAQTTIQVLCLPKAPGVAVRPPPLISGAGEVCDAE